MKKATRTKYSAYLKTPKWQEKRQRCIEAAEGECQRCGLKSDKLQAHHLTYKNIFNELQKDLIALCPGCHIRVEYFKKKRRGKTVWARRVDAYACRMYGRDWKSRCSVKMVEAELRDLIDRSVA